MMAGETVKSGGVRNGAGRKAKPDAEGRMSLLGHLSELRKRLIICLVCFLVCFSACLSQSEWFTQLLLSRGEQFTFVYIAPTELFMSYIRIALVGGVVVTVPVISYQIWKFIRPGLRGKECVVVLLVMTAGLGLFALGAFFAFSVVLPILLSFFARLDTTGSVTAMVSIQEYIGYLLSTMITFGVVFETPIILMLLTAVGAVRPKTLQKNFKYVVLIILILSAVITPPDVTSQILMAVPLMILFYLSILLCRLLFRRKLAKLEQEEQAQAE